MKKHTLLLSFFCFLLLLGILLHNSVASLSPHSSYIIVDNETGCILEQNRANKEAPVASLSKLALAVITIDWEFIHHESLATTITVPSDVLTPDIDNRFQLQEGDIISARDLLYLTLLASDPAASRILAYYLGTKLPNPLRLDPISNSVAAMNTLAAQLGMRRSRFLNPQGADTLPNGATSYSTPADLARLTRYAYSKQGIPFYVLQKTRKVSLVRNGKRLQTTIHNTNQLLGKNFIDGVKTGSSKRASQCIILSSRRPTEVRQEGNIFYKTPRRIIVVLLGSNNRFSEGFELDKHGWKLYNQWAEEGRPKNRLYL